MYGFHKIKNDRGFHEFKHQQFRKDRYDDLAHIRRKNFVGERESGPRDAEADNEELARLKDKLDTTKNSLETVTRQNMQLIANNKEVAGQLYGFKQEYEQKLSRFFFMFYFIINVKGDELLILLKKTLSDLGIVFHDDKTRTIEQRTLDAYQYINEEVLVNSNYDHAIITKLLNAFAVHFNADSAIPETTQRLEKQRKCTFMSTETPDRINDAESEERYEDEEWNEERIFEEQNDDCREDSCFDELRDI